MQNDRTLDDIDLQILDLLQANARETQVEIARAVGLAPSAVLERIRKLEARGILRGYAAQIDPKALGLGLLAFVAVRSDEAGSDNRIAQALAELPEVLEVHHVAGDDCYLIKVRARDAEHLGHLLRTRFGRIPGVRSTRTTIVLETVKETPRLPICQAAREARAMTPAAAHAAPARVLRVGRRLPDLGHDVPRHPRQPRDDAAGADGRPALDCSPASLLAAYLVARGEPASAAVAVGRRSRSSGS